MSEKKSSPPKLQSYFHAINQKSDDGVMIVQFLRKKEQAFVKFAARYGKGKLAEKQLDEFVTSMKEAGFSNLEEFLEAHKNKRWLTSMVSPPGHTKKKKATPHRAPPHPILSFAPEAMKEYVDKVRAEMVKTGLPPLRAANAVAERDYKITEPLKYLSLKNAILHKYAPDLIPANQSPTPAPKF